MSELRSHRADYPYADAPRLPELGALDPREFLAGSTPVELEIGPGRGGFILERLAHDPDVRIFGLEIRRKWATLVQRKIAEHGWANRGALYAEDAKLILPRLVDACLGRIYVHFPDPWWKKRHAKRLIAQASLADAAARLLRPGGEFFVQTDVEERAELYQTLFDAHSGFEPLLPEGPRSPDPEFGARSPRERRALEDGLPIVRLRYRRKES